MGFSPCGSAVQPSGIPHGLKPILPAWRQTQSVGRQWTSNRQAASGEDRQLAPLTIFKPEKGRNYAKNPKIVKIVNVLLLTIFRVWRACGR